MTSEEMEALLLYRDGLMLVLDKPAGLPVHRGPKAAGMKNVRALEDDFGALRFGLPRAPGLAHRLDRETSGCLVLGRHRKALETLTKLFKDKKIAKTYWALVEGGPAEDEGVIDLPLGRRDESRGWWMKVDPAGQPSETRWKVMGRSSSYPSPFGGGSSRSDGVGAIQTENTKTPPDATQPSSRSLRELGCDGATLPLQGRDYTWLALEPVTGRTHQLRVHCQASGWPIVGDSIYGTAPRFGGPVLHLLAREIVVPLYKNRDPIRVTAPVPPHMRDGLAACGWVEDDLHLSHQRPKREDAPQG